MINKLIVSLMVSLLTTIQINAIELDSISVVSEEYDSQTNADGTGVYWEVIEKVYGDTGASIKKEVVSYARAVLMVKNKKADFWVASYADEEDFALYPKYPFDSDNVTALFSKDINWIGPKENLENKRISWVRGYDYDSYLDFSVNGTEVDMGENGIKMLAAKRVDYYLDAKSEIVHYIQEMGLSQDDFKMHKVINLPLYMAFQNTEKGMKLKEIWDQKFPELLKNGEIDKIYQKYGLELDKEIFSNL